MHSRLLKIVSLAMAVLFPFAMMAADSGAMAFPTGQVSVNGKVLSNPTAIFSGDRISTANGSLSMRVGGSTVQVGSKSAVQYTSGQMSLSSGGIKVSTANGLAGHVRNLTLRPEGKAVYTVAERDGKVMIAALEGNLALNDGHGQVMLAANHAVAIPVQDQSTDQATCKKGDKQCEKAVKACKGDKTCEQQAVSAAASGGAAAAGAGAAGGAAAGAGAGAGAGLSTAAIVGISVAAAAAAAGIGVGIANATSSSSPSHP